MVTRARIWVFLAAFVFAFGNAAATPIAPSQIVAFGDSLSDGGNAAAATLVLQQDYQTIPFAAGTTSFVPSAPYLLTPNPLDARFSNGPVWVERLAQGLGVPLNPSALGGTNFAFGGADSGPLPGVPTDPIPSLTQQAELYLGGVGGIADHEALFVVFGGGNDLRALGQVTAAAAAEAFTRVLLATGNTSLAQLAGQEAAALAARELVTASATNLLGVVDTLRRAGAINFLIPLVPDVSLTPDAQNLDPGTRRLVSALSFGLNQLLLQSLLPLSGTPGLNINILDTFSLFGDVVANPWAYGLDNATDACITTVVCDDPSKYLFWDGIHPTSAGHQILADAALRLVRVPEPSSLVLMGLGLLVIGWSIRRRMR